MRFNLFYKFGEKNNAIDNGIFDTSWSFISSKVLRMHNINDNDDESIRGQTLSYGLNMILKPSMQYYYALFETPFHFGYALLSLQKKYGLKSKLEVPLMSINYKKSVVESIISDIIEPMIVSGIENISTKTTLSYPGIKMSEVLTSGFPYFDVNYGIIYNDTFSCPLDKSTKISDYVNTIRKDMKVTNENKIKFGYNISFLQTVISNDDNTTNVIKKYDTTHTITQITGRDLMDKEVYEASFDYLSCIIYEEGAMKFAQSCDKLLEMQKSLLSKI